MKEDRALLGDGNLALYQSFSLSWTWLGGSLLMVGVSPTVDLITIFGFLGGRSTFLDGFLLVDGLA